MKILLLIALFCGSLSSNAQKELTTFILIRHAEKVANGSKNPELSEEGKRRALSLVELFKNTSIDAIFSTAFVRTESTVKPLANARALEVKYYEAFKPEVIDSMKSEYRGGTVVVCGHSNNIPWIANYLTASQAYKDFLDSDYGNILIITILADGKDSKVTWLRF